MNNETIIQIGTSKYKVFLQEGFYDFASRTNRLHKHNYPEIHLVAKGTAQLLIDKTICDLQKGDIFVIPAGQYHCYTEYALDASSCAFQIDATISVFLKHNVPVQILQELFKEIVKCKKSGNYVHVIPFLSLIYSYIFPEESLYATPITD